MVIKINLVRAIIAFLEIPKEFKLFRKDNIKDIERIYKPVSNYKKKFIRMILWVGGGSFFLEQV